MLVTTPNRLRDDHEDWIDADVLCDYGIDQPKYYHTAYTPSQLGDMVSSTGLVVEDKDHLRTRLPIVIR